MKPTLLVLELWGLGDLAIASLFLRGAQEQFEVTLLAKPKASLLAEHLVPGIKVLSLEAPWTRFSGKYHLPTWRWRELQSAVTLLRQRNFDVAVSARPDPRDHVLMLLSGAKMRIGFPRLGSFWLLSKSLSAVRPHMHRLTAWRKVASALKIELPVLSSRFNGEGAGTVLVHSGAARSTRVWPLAEFANIVDKLRGVGYPVQVMCDEAQKAWWLTHGEEEVSLATNPAELCEMLTTARVFIGNDSGPGHLAAILGVPTFTIFGPQLPQLFAPVHPMAEWVDGRPCKYKPCKDSCHFEQTHCIQISSHQLWPKLIAFVGKHAPPSQSLLTIFATAIWIANATG
jgi:ADP-heptose:LPS heptosyltransferase